MAPRAWRGHTAALEYDSNNPGFWDNNLDVRDVTALHLGSRAWECGWDQGGS
jgi:hypothetical protein